MHTINNIYVHVELFLPVPLPNDYHALPDYGQKPAHQHVSLTSALATKCCIDIGLIVQGVIS